MVPPDVLTKSRLFRAFTLLLSVCALLQFVRYYVVSTYFYLDMPRYLTGQERLPFQERILPVFLMWPISHSPFLMHHLSHAKRGVFTPSAATAETTPFYLVSLLSLTIASVLVVRLYRAVTQTSLLGPLVFPIFLVLTMWTYVVHIDANYSYPYDMPSLAFFTGGLLAIYKRAYLPLLAVMFVGTMNRETTLFLVGIYILDAATREETSLPASGGALPLRVRFNPAQVSWVRALILLVIWCVVRAFIHHRFAHNDNSENFVRLWGNFGRLSPRLWPTLLNICGYVLPVVLILRSRLQPLRFANYLYILPLWLAVMFYTGVILETRIWGELCSYTAVAVVLLLESYIEQVRPRQLPAPRLRIDEHAMHDR